MLAAVAPFVYRVAFVLLLLVSLSVPIIKAIYKLPRPIGRARGLAFTIGKRECMVRRMGLLYFTSRRLVSD